MTATTIRQVEAAPASYPTAPSGLSAAAAALDAAMIWQRIESYIAYRFAEREVVWIVEGPGEWAPPLAPATVTATEVWEGDAWASFTPTPSPLGGYVLPGCGAYRFTADVGGGAVPERVTEAVRRLAEYFAGAAQSANPGLRQETVEGVGSFDYDAGTIAKAMERSGAGDLLRPYRMVS